MRKYLFVQIKSISFWLIVPICILFVPTISFAASASFYLSPETGVYTIGDEFPVAVMLNTDGADITAAGGKIEFNNKELKVVSISKENSLFTSWIDEENSLNGLNICLQNSL